MRRAEAGRGAFALVTGEPGIGKTTLVEHAAGRPAGACGHARRRHAEAPARPVATGCAGRRARRRSPFDPGLDAGRPTPVTGGTGYERFLRFDAVIESLREASRVRTRSSWCSTTSSGPTASHALAARAARRRARPAAARGRRHHATRALHPALPRAALTVELTGLGAVRGPRAGRVGRRRTARRRRWSTPRSSSPAATRSSSARWLATSVRPAPRSTRVRGAACSPTAPAPCSAASSETSIPRSRDAVQAAAVLGAIVRVDESPPYSGLDRQSTAYAALDPVAAHGPRARHPRRAVRVRARAGARGRPRRARPGDPPRAARAGGRGGEPLRRRRGAAADRRALRRRRRPRREQRALVGTRRRARRTRRRCTPRRASASKPRARASARRCRPRCSSRSPRRCRVRASPTGLGSSSSTSRAAAARRATPTLLARAALGVGVDRRWLRDPRARRRADRPARRSAHGHGRLPAAGRAIIGALVGRAESRRRP